MSPADRDALRDRVHARPRVRRALGPRRSVRLARLRGGAEWWLRPAPRRAAVERAHLVLGPGARRSQVRDLARANVVELAIQAEQTWRPWEAARAPVRGLAHLEAARAQGRGVVLATAHVGPSVNLVHPLTARGHPVHMASSRLPDDELAPGARGRWIRHQNRWMRRAGSHLVPVRHGGAYDALRALLEGGETCWINWDVPGPLRFPLLGRTAGVRSGLARLARQTGAPVVPAFMFREGDGQVAQVLAPLDPAAYADEGTLMAGLAARVEPVLRPRLAQAQPFFVACLR